MQPTFKPSPAEHPAHSASNLRVPALKSRTFQCMGTVISLALPAGATLDDGQVLDGATAAVERVFTGLDGCSASTVPIPKRAGSPGARSRSGRPRRHSVPALRTPQGGGC